MRADGDAPCQLSVKQSYDDDTDFPAKVDRNIYPRPEYRFPHVKIGLTYKDSAADFARPVQAADGSSNILLALLDDVGPPGRALPVAWFKRRRPSAWQEMD